MGTFTEHINHSKSNLSFLESISNNIDNCWDWQVTVCFYSALHLVNAHLVEKTNANYLSHKKVDEMINPYTKLSVSKLDEDTYASYQSLSHLSRRSRYLLNEKRKREVTGEGGIARACITHGKHLAKAVRHLDVIIDYMHTNYSLSIPKIEIKCVDLRGENLKHFNVKG